MLLSTDASGNLKICTFKEHKKLFTSVWLEFLKHKVKFMTTLTILVGIPVLTCNLISKLGIWFREAQMPDPVSDTFLLPCNIQYLASELVLLQLVCTICVSVLWFELVSEELSLVFYINLSRSLCMSYTRFLCSPL